MMVVYAMIRALAEDAGSPVGLEAWLEGGGEVHQAISHRDFPKAASRPMWAWPAVITSSTNMGRYMDTLTYSQPGNTPASSSVRNGG